MVDVEMVVDSPVQESMQLEKKVKRTLKRKRVSLVPENVTEEEKQSRVDELRKELQSLIHFFKELLLQKGHLEENDLFSSCSGNSVFACLLEESELPFSKLVGEIYDRLKSREGVTLASVRSSVLFVGQRSAYGVANADADVLEDDTDECLWCWETRDLKLLPKADRGLMSIRRTCRKKIHERITAVSGMICALEMPLGNQSYKADLIKASEKLNKVLNEADIRLLMDSMVQKNGADMAGKEAKLKEKELTKELERNKREVEKEKKRMDRELQKDKLQSEKEQKRMQEEAEKEAKRREKEEAEMKKQLKKQQEEAEKEQRRREKEAADVRNQLAIKKQATIMERFLKIKKKDTDNQDTASPARATPNDSNKEKGEDTLTAVTLSMDRALSLKNDVETSDICRSHFGAWNRLGRSNRTDKSRHWGIRQKPKTVLAKEIKLQGPSSEGCDSVKKLSSDKGSHVDLSTEKLVDGLEETILEDKACQHNEDSSRSEIISCNRTKKLLQFDKSHRPAYYGTLSKKSEVIGPRHPFEKDPELDYDIESDEEWEEEEPGESLSDCDKAEDEDNIDEGSVKAEDEDESEDGFFVPDGYLSENEGVQVDSMEVDSEDDDDKSSPRCKKEVECEEFHALLRQQKYIQSLTERALIKNQPLIISNLMHEKTSLLISEGLTGTSKLEQTFLQALSIRPFLGGPAIEAVPDNCTQDEVQEIPQSQATCTPTPATSARVIQDKDMPKVVSSIQSCSQGINKIVESLQQKFPTVPKTQLRSTVREIANFVDNRWQVKKEVMEKLGISITPEKCRGRTKSIATFFSKRCLPPAAATMKVDETSPQPFRKSETLHNEQAGCAEKLF